MTKPVIHSDAFIEILKIADPAMSQADLMEHFTINDACGLSLPATWSPEAADRMSQELGQEKALEIWAFWPSIVKAISRQ